MLLQGMLFGGFNDMDVAGDCNIDFYDVNFYIDACQAVLGHRNATVHLL